MEWGAHDGFEPLGSDPPEFADEVVERFGDYSVIGKCDDYARAGDYDGLRDALLRAPAVKGELFGSLLDRDTWDFFFATFSESHCAGHQFWSNHDPTHPDHDPIAREAHGDVIFAVYEAIDRSLGDVLTHVPDDASLMVLLSHGIGPHYDGEHIMAAILRVLDADEGTSRVLELARAGRATAATPRTAGTPWPRPRQRAPLLQGSQQRAVHGRSTQREGP